MTEPRIYRASSLGYSLEALVAPHLGYEPIPPPERMQAIFDEGNRLEPVVIGKLRKIGFHVDQEQLEVELDIIPGVAKVVGHLDGIVSGFERDESLDYVLEIKTMAGKAYDAFKAGGWDTNSSLIEKYKWQASAYMLATGKKHYMVAWNKAAPAENPEMCYFVCGEPFYTISDIANKLQAAEDAIAAGVIPEGCTDYPCPYFYLHPPIEEPEPADETLNGLLDAWKEANRRKKIEEGAEKALREMIKEYVGEIAGKVKGSQGITVSTNWVEAADVSYTKPAHWETRITAARERKVKEKSNVLHDSE